MALFDGEDISLLQNPARCAKIIMRENIRAGRLPQTVGGWPLVHSEGVFSLRKERRAMPMVTYSDLFLLGTLIVSIIALVVDLQTKKK